MAFTMTPSTRFAERISNKYAILTGTITLDDPDANGQATVEDSSSRGIDDYFKTLLAVNLIIPDAAQNDGTNHYDFTFDISDNTLTCYQENATSGVTDVIATDISALGDIQFVAFGLLE